MYSTGLRAVLTLLVVVALRQLATAQQAPDLGYLYPPAVQAGSSQDVQVGGYDFTPDMQLFVHDRRVTLTALGPPGDFLITPPPYWFGPKSRSNALPIPREMPARLEVPAGTPAGIYYWQVANANGSSPTALLLVSDGIELLEHRYRQQPQELNELPVAVSGRLERIAEVDRYQFTARDNGMTRVELFARRLGADFHGVLEVRDQHGRLIADTADTQGLDTAIEFSAQADQSYVVSVHDVDFRGHRSYVYRLAFSKTNGLPATVTSPPEGRPLAGLGGDAEQPMQVDIPAVVDGMLGLAPDSLHRYRWAARQGQTLSIRLQSRAVGGQLDVSLDVRDESGKSLASNDDLPGTTDAGLEFTAPSDGVYECVVSALPAASRDVARNYRLSLRLLEPGFALSVPQQASLLVGGSAELTIQARRQAGFQDAITVELRGLPAGVTASGPLQIAAGQSELKVPLQCANGSVASAALVEIVGTATVGQESIVRTARCGARGNLCPADPEAESTNRVLIATTMQPPFTLELVDKNRQRAVHRGTTYPAEFLVVREPGFDGEVILMMAARQARHRQGIRAPEVIVPPGVDRVLFPCYLPEWLETDRTTRMAVLGAAKVADPLGNIRYVTRPCEARVTMILEGALLKISQRAQELTVQPGQSFDILLDVSRSAQLQEAVTIRLIIPPELEGVLHCDPLELAAQQDQAELTVHTSGHPRLTGQWNLTVQATALQDGQWPVISQTDVTVEF